MADNFNLRQYLSENKLTKNAKLLKENSNWGITLDGKQVDIQSIGIDGIDPADRPDFVDAYIAYAEFEDGTPLTDEELTRVQDENYGLVNDLINSKQLDLDEGYDDEPYYSDVKNKTSKRWDSDDAEDLENNDVDEARQPESKLAQVIQQAWAEKDIIKAKQLIIDLITPSRIKSKDTILTTLKGINNQARLDQYLANSLLKFEKLGLEESKLTAKEQALVEMVQNALGIAPQAVAEEAPIAEEVPMAEDEMVQENPLPKYKNIDELMSNIEQGTNEAAHKYKMNRMKEVAEALEAKVGSLEEGENAEHIDQKVVKQMRKDIQALRKAEEKLRKEFEKKFANKKEVKEDK